MPSPRALASTMFDSDVEDVEFKGKNVGFLGQKDGSTVFFWVQVELHGKSDFRGDAYSMSTPLIERLEQEEVESVYVENAETWIPFEDIQNGELLEKDDDFFDEEQDYDQRIAYVESW